jgi:HK97 family phage prohead protease
MSETTVLPLQLRAAADGHTLEGLCVPYGRTSMKAGYPRGERFVAGAFADAGRFVNKIRLTDYHVPGQQKRPVGVATDFRDSPDGLYGVFRFYDTPEGRGAFENVLEGTYGGLSVGFYTDAERIGSDGAREVVQGKLFHVALVDEPAYAEAQVIAVRSALPDVAALLAVRYDLADFPDPPDMATVVFGGLVRS